MMRYLLIGLPLVLSCVLVLLSFFKGSEFAVFGYGVGSLELLGILGALYWGLMLLLFMENKERFKSRLEISQIIFLHLVATALLLFCGAYSLALWMQFLFPLLLLRKMGAFLLGMFLFFEHLILLALFGSGNYWLYFGYFALLLFFFWMRKVYFQGVSLLGCGVVIGLLYGAGHLLEEFLFELYIWTGVADRTVALDITVLGGLTILHIFAFFLIRYKKNRSFKKY